MTFMTRYPRGKFYLLLGVLVTGILICSTYAFSTSTSAPSVTWSKATGESGSPPEASTCTGTSVENTTKITTIFVQEASGGSFVRDPTGNYTLTMTDAIPYTLFFTDRPARDAGFAPTDKFIEGYNWDPDNPPNALIMVQDGKDRDTVVVKLTSPRYNETGHSLTYNAQVVPYASFKSDWASDLSQMEMADARIPATFGHVTLVIDDCPCTADNVPPDEYSRCKSGCHESCWNWKKFTCYTDCGRCCECGGYVCDTC
jgi:hypothetical protein